MMWGFFFRYTWWSCSETAHHSHTFEAWMDLCRSFADLSLLLCWRLGEGCRTLCP